MIEDQRPDAPARSMKLASVALALALAMLSGCAWRDGGMLAPAGPVAETQRAALVSILGWMAVVIAPLLVALPIILWRYRRSGGRGRYAPDWASSRILEWLIWGAPAVVVVVLGFGLWSASHALDPYAPIPGPEKPLEVEVVALDWKFLFLYPEEGLAAVNELVIPAGRPIRFRLTSGTAMQSFIIPRLGGQIYVMAGMVTELNLRADEPGVYQGRNAQYNGEGFADQVFETRALTPAAFADWAKEVRATSPTLDAAGLASLTERSRVGRPVHFGGYKRALFRDVVASFTADPGESGR